MHFYRQRKRFGVLLGLGLFAPVFLSCDRVSVTSVAVATVSVVPANVELVTGQVLQLSALALDGSGAQLNAGTIEWSVNPADIVEINASGRAVGLAPGVATITASTGGVVGAAAVSVGVPGVLALSATEASFSAIKGGASPPTQAVQVDVDGGLATSLATDVIYSGSPGGWLAATLDADRAPATLSLAPTTGSLPAGIHTARVALTSPSATNSPLEISVSFTVESTSILLSTDTVAFTGSATQNVQVDNGGTGELTGLSSSVEYTTGEPTGWLTAGLGSTAAPATLAVISNDAPLPPGNYTARVVVSSAISGVDDAVLVVTLQGGQNAPILAVTPDTVRLTAPQGGSATGTANITNRGTGLLVGLRKAIGYAPGQATGWLSSSLSSTTAPSVLTAVANTSGLTVGSYNGSIEVSAAAPNSPVNVPVLLTVTSVVVLPPSAPNGLTATVGSTPPVVTLNWTDASTNETRFEVRRRSAGTGSFQLVASPAANMGTYMDSGVTAGASYDYGVRACNSGGCSAWTSNANATIPGSLTRPSTPTVPVLSVLSAIDIDMVWTDTDTQTATFDLDRRGPSGSWSRIASLAQWTQTYRDTGLAPGVEYRYRVRACNAAGCSKFSANARATTQNPTQVPASPANPKILRASRQLVEIGWSDISFDETTFVIEEGSLTSSWTVIGQVGVNLNSFIDTNVVTGQQIFYRVRACNPVGCSGAFAVSVTVP